MMATITSGPPPFTPWRAGTPSRAPRPSWRRLLLLPSRTGALQLSWGPLFVHFVETVLSRKEDEEPGLADGYGLSAANPPLPVPRPLSRGRRVVPRPLVPLASPLPSVLRRAPLLPVVLGAAVARFYAQAGGGTPPRWDLAEAVRLVLGRRVPRRPPRPGRADRPAGGLAWSRQASAPAGGPASVQTGAGPRERSSCPRPCSLRTPASARFTSGTRWAPRRRLLVLAVPAPR
jgi:hypothetical protein